MIKTIIASLFISLSVLFSTPQVNQNEVSISNDVTIYLFYLPSCSECKAEKEYINELTGEYSYIDTVQFDISTGNDQNIALLNKVGEVFSETSIVTPFSVIGGKHFVGFNANVKLQLKKYAQKYHSNAFTDIIYKIQNNQEILSTDIDISSETEFELPLIGNVDVKTISIGLLAMVLGFVDGFNPCATWVLIFLVSLLVSTKSKKKALIIGGTFLFISALFYFAIMMAWIGTISIISAKTIFQIIIGIFAILAGLFNVYQFIKSMKKKDEGCEVVNEKSHNKLVERVKRIVNQQNLLLALLGASFLALIVNFIELACSSGLPVIFLQILSINAIDGWTRVFYILIYVFFFIIDDIVIFVTLLLTSRIKGISAKVTKYTHLIGAIIMLTLGILMVFFPSIIMFSF